MTSAELLQHLREFVLRDDSAPSLWGDVELLRYLDEAQRNMARFTHCLVSTTGDVATLTTVAGTGQYPLDTCALHVSAVFCEELQRELTPAPYAPFTVMAGTPSAFRAVIDNNPSLLVFPIPEGEYTLRLRVAHDPLTKMVDGADPEVAEHYQLMLCDWAAYRALRANDPEQLNMQAANDFLTQWKLSLRDIKRDVYQMNTGPHPRATTNWTYKGA